MAMTLAEIKRKADAGNMYLELVERFGSQGADIPERFRGVRRVLRSASFGLVLEFGSKESRLVIDSAKLVECDGHSLTVYNAGHRELTEEERSILDQWRAFEKDYWNKNPFGNGPWVYRKKFFKDHGYPYMAGYDIVQGKKYLEHEDKVLDMQVRGIPVCRYNVVLA